MVGGLLEGGNCEGECQQYDILGGGSKLGWKSWKLGWRQVDNVED